MQLQVGSYMHIVSSTLYTAVDPVGMPWLQPLKLEARLTARNAAILWVIKGYWAAA